MRAIHTGLAAMALLAGARPGAVEPEFAAVRRPNSQRFDCEGPGCGRDGTCPAPRPCRRG